MVANLGAVFARAGERVVLVSCDLRRPRLGEFFGLDEKSGLTTVLQGERTLEQELQQVPGYDCLRVLGAGVLPPNPAELLNGPKARQVFAALRENFDLVLVDSPPVLPVTDAMVLSTYADGTLVVVAAGQTRQAALHRTAERFAQAKAPLVGIVLNQVTKENGYGYGYGYGYEYRSSYGSYAPEPSLAALLTSANGHPNGPCRRRPMATRTVRCRRRPMATRTVLCRRRPMATRTVLLRPAKAQSPGHVSDALGRRSAGSWASAMIS